MNTDTELYRFMQKFDACDFAYRLYESGKMGTTLKEGWRNSDTACVVFLYIKGANNAEAHVLYEFATRVSSYCADRGKIAVAELILSMVDQSRRNLSDVLELQHQMNDLIVISERKYNHDKALRRTALSFARDAALFAFDFAMQNFCGKYNILFSYRMAEIFREVVGANPFE